MKVENHPPKQPSSATDPSSKPCKTSRCSHSLQSSNRATIKDHAHPQLQPSNPLHLKVSSRESKKKSRCLFCSAITGTMVVTSVSVKGEPFCPRGLPVFINKGKGGIINASRLLFVWPMNVDNVIRLSARKRGDPSMLVAC